MTQVDSSKFIRRDGQASVLVIESDPLMLTAMGSVLHMRGHRIVLARNEAIALESIQSGQFDLLILSIESLEQGCAFAARLRRGIASRDVPVVFLVPELSQRWSEKLRDEGGVFSMLKPFEPEALIEIAERALWLPHVARSRLGSQGTHLSHQSDWISLANE